MINTELSLEVSRNLNIKVLRLFDTSFYHNDQIVENYLIEILPVNKTNWVTHSVNKNFSLVLNSSSLGYRRAASSDELIDLIDGIYEIKQSYKPNILTLNHFYHLRTVSIRIKYNELLHNHFSSECSKTTRQYSADTDRLSEIREYIEAAEYVVEDKHDKVSGIKYYNHAIDLIKSFENECGCR